MANKLNCIVQVDSQHLRVQEIQSWQLAPQEISFCLMETGTTSSHSHAQHSQLTRHENLVRDVTIMDTSLNMAFQLIHVLLKFTIHVTMKLVKPITIQCSNSLQQVMDIRKVSYLCFVYFWNFLSNSILILFLK